MKDKKNILIGVLIGIIVLLIGLCVYLEFFKKEEVKKDNNQVSESTDKVINDTSNKKIEISTVVGSYVGNMYLDTNGRVYFELSDELRKDEKYKSIVNQEIKINELNVVDLNEQGIKEIEYLVNGQAGYGYYTMLTEDNNLHVIDSEQIERNSVLEVIKPSLLYSIKSTGVDFDVDGSFAYAIYSNNDKIYLIDAINSKVERIELTKNNQNIKFNGKNIAMKVVNDKLYINNKETSVMFDNFAYAYVTNKFILLVDEGGQCFGDYILGAINENYEYIDIIKDDRYVGIMHVRDKDNKIFAKAEVRTEFDLCGEVADIELVYSKDKITIKEVK